MKTKKAPWDYDRNGVLTADETNAMNDLKDRVKIAEDELRRINSAEFIEINRRWYGGWVNLRGYYADLCNALDGYECNCTPTGPTCNGCKRLYDAKER